MKILYTRVQLSRIVHAKICEFNNQIKRYDEVIAQAVLSLSVSQKRRLSCRERKFIIRKHSTLYFTFEE